MKHCRRNCRIGRHSPAGSNGYGLGFGCFAYRRMLMGVTVAAEIGGPCRCFHYQCIIVSFKETAKIVAEADSLNEK